MKRFSSADRFTKNVFAFSRIARNVQLEAIFIEKPIRKIAMADPGSSEEGTPTQTLPIEKKYAMKLKNWYVGLTPPPQIP